MWLISAHLSFGAALQKWTPLSSLKIQLWGLARSSSLAPVLAPALSLLKKFIQLLQGFLLFDWFGR